MSFKSYLLPAVFLVIYIAVLFSKLVTHPQPFFDWDESIYMKVGAEMIKNSSALATWQGTPWLEKPQLVPLLYGIVSSLTPTIPEVSTRVFSLFMSATALTLVYAWVLRFTRSTAIAFVTMVITACNPIFLQRAQTVNTDVFLLIGWLGYLYFYQQKGARFLFLLLGVLSKSLLGFYPVVLIFGFNVFQYLQHKLSKKEFVAQIRAMAVETGVLLLWYVVMMVMFGKEFITIHFQDHLVRRVTSSIESHFGARTFYLDLVVSEYRYFLIFAVITTLLLLKNIWQKKTIDWSVFAVSYLFPWFVFLNLTKTKISWYLYPAIPQVALFLAYPLLLLREKRLILVAGLVISVVVMYQTFNQGLLTNFYSQKDDFYTASLQAKKLCSQVLYLPSPEDRKTHDVLQSMNLLISTSELYGPHPALAYYMDRPMKPYYSTQSLLNDLKKSKGCVLLHSEDQSTMEGLQVKKLGGFGTLLLYQKP